MSAAYLNVRLVTPFRPCWPTLFLPSGLLIILIIQQQYSNLQRMQSLKIIYTFNLSVTPDTEPSFYFPYRTIRISLASENPSSWKDMHQCSSLNQPPRTFLLQSFDASQYPSLSGPCISWRSCDWISSKVDFGFFEERKLLLTTCYCHNDSFHDTILVVSTKIT